EDCYLATTDGGRIDQQMTRLWPGCTVVASAAPGGDFATRDIDLPPAQRGFEYIEEADLPALAERAADEAVAKLRAPRVAPGVRDIVIHPSNLWIALHETVAHPLDLDRAFGYEGETPGRSFVLSTEIGSLRYGSELMNVTADRTLAGGLSTAGYDDEGI